MIVDALLEADKALRFSEKIHHAKDFVTLDDSLLKSIENFHLYNPGCGSAACTLLNVCLLQSTHSTPPYSRAQMSCRCSE